MKKTRIVTLLLVLCMLMAILPQPVWAEPEEETEPVVTAAWEADPTAYRENQLTDVQDYEAGCRTALLLELNSGIVIYAKNAEERVYPASLTKIMTCLLALQYGSDILNDYVTVSYEALDGIAEAGGEVKLKVGDRMTLRDILYYLMVVSSNEAANVVAEAIGGNIPTFVNMMNETAKEIGCTDTHFENAHGLRDVNYTTARDMSIITRTALRYDLFREITSTAEIKLPANAEEQTRLVSTNYLILNDGNRYLADNGEYHSYYYDRATGIKTGYTSAAGRCVVTRATDGNMDLLCIIMGAATREMEDGSIRLDNFVEAKKLLQYGFNNYSYATVAVSGIRPMFPENVKYSKDKREVILVPSEDVNCLLPRDYDSDKVTYYEELNSPGGLTAPLRAGQIVGSVTIYYDDREIGQTTLQTMTKVDEKTVDKTVSEVIDVLNGNETQEETGELSAQTEDPA